MLTKFQGDQRLIGMSPINCLNSSFCKGSIKVENILEGLGEQGDNNEDEVHNIPDSDMDPDMDYDI